VTSLFQKLKESPPAPSNYRNRVQETSEFKRIKSIPRHEEWYVENPAPDFDKIVFQEYVAEHETHFWKTDKGTMELWPIQVWAKAKL
jgi:hypothetical protein